jgi:hypothetical protein
MRKIAKITRAARDEVERPVLKGRAKALLFVFFDRIRGRK